MYADAKKAWTQALRSDRFKQGRTALKSRKAMSPEDWEHCCLGVLCEIAIEAGVEVDVAQGKWQTSFGGEHAYLPDAVREWAGLEDRSPSVREGGSRVELVSLNDGTATNPPHSFVEIADLIHEMPEEVRPG